MPLSPARAAALLADNVQRVIQGKPDVVRLATVALFAEGHLLLEDVPGTGKTSLARSLARSIGGRWSRIQFTPDLLPGDITGVMVYQQGTGSFEFRPGGVFANVVLADEINRGTPKTQSALLEVMAERMVTVDSVPHAVPRPFLVVATQNPIELDGTYRLPEAQLDRFLMRVGVGYPDHDAEVRVVLGAATGVDPDALTPVLDLPELAAVIAQVRRLHVDPLVAGYAVQLAAATREHPAVRYGASPRGSVALVAAARAAAAIEDRSFVTPDDVKTIAHAGARPPDRAHPGGRAEPPDGGRGARRRARRDPAADSPAGRGAGLTVRPTPRGTAVLVGAVALLVLGVVLNLPLLRALAGVMLGAVALAFVPTAGRLRLGVTRAVHPDRVDTGAPAFAELVVRNRTHSRRPGFTAVDAVGSQVTPVRVRSLPPGGSARYRYELPTTRRGRIPVGPLSVERTDLLGLACNRAGRRRGDPRVGPPAPARGAAGRGRTGAAPPRGRSAAASDGGGDGPAGAARRTCPATSCATCTGRPRRGPGS